MSGHEDSKSFMGMGFRVNPELEDGQFALVSDRTIVGCDTNNGSTTFVKAEILPTGKILVTDEWVERSG